MHNADVTRAKKLAQIFQQIFTIISRPILLIFFSDFDNVISFKSYSKTYEIRSFLTHMIIVFKYSRAVYVQ